MFSVFAGILLSIGPFSLNLFASSAIISGSMMIFLVGLIAGIFGGLVGLGGGVIMIPLMVGIKKFTQHKAHGTSLVALVFTGIAGAITYLLKGSVDIVASALLAGTAVFTARAGAKFAHALPEWKLKRSFGGFLIFVSLLLLTKPYLPGLVLSTVGWYKAGILLLTGVFTGFLSGMMGVGGGTIMVPAMVLLTGMGQHISQVQRFLPWCLLAVRVHTRMGSSEMLREQCLQNSFQEFLSEHTLAQSLPITCLNQPCGSSLLRFLSGLAAAI